MIEEAREVAEDGMEQSKLAGIYRMSWQIATKYHLERAARLFVA